MPTVTDPDADFVIGKGKLLREGTDVTLIACGMMVAVALDAAELLAAEGVHAAVIDMSTIKPIDRAIICEWAEKTGAVVTAEEHNSIGGLGSAVSEVLALECPTPLEMVGVEDVRSPRRKIWPHERAHRRESQKSHRAQINQPFVRGWV